MIRIFALVCLLFAAWPVAGFSQNHNKGMYHLIAHRGGVVDEHTAENSRESIEKAIAHGYWMIEIDLRVTKDGVMIINHDRDFKRYYNIDKTVDQMTWEEIKKLRSANGQTVLKFEDALKLCKGKMQVMIDNKIKGNDTVLFGNMINLLKKYGLYEKALTIGTDESTEFFTGKIKLSCTRQQLEDNMKKPGFRPGDYYLFSNNITKDDVDWAQRNNILVVGVLNSWALKNNSREDIKKIAEDMKASGVKYFQVDSEYERLFKY